MEDKTIQPPVIVTGMHRSGTSLVASILSALWIEMGQQLLPADANNKRGYFEDIEFLQLQRNMLAACCATDDGGHPDWGWTENETLDKSCFKRFLPQASALIATRSERPTPWVWKDPCTTLLLDFWDRLLDDARYILVYRYPWDVADSLQQLGVDTFLRNPEYGYRIWEFYNRQIRDFYIKHPDKCLLVSSNVLRGNGGELIKLLQDKLAIQLSSAQPDDFESHPLKSICGSDPLIDLMAAVWPDCITLLTELDDLADISATGLWQARPVRSRLTRPDRAADDCPIDVSVITPCYNQGVFLIEAIASVERFAPPGCELIIVNDGSRQPRTLEIFDTLKGCGYFIVDQQNLGLPAARNRGIEMSHGRYILPLDDDNRIRANFIEDAKRVLDSSPDIGVVYGDRYDFGLQTGSRQIPEFDAPMLIEENYIDACAIFRKQVWKDCGGYDSRMPAWEDWEFWVHAAELGWRFYHLPYLAFDYRVRPDSLVSLTARPGMRQKLRELVLLKHPRAHVGLLSSELAAEKLHVQALLSRLASEQERVQAFSVQLAAEQEQVQVLSARLAAEQEQVQLLSATAEQNKEQISEGRATIQTLTSEATASRQERRALLDQLGERDAELARIKRSRGWRLLESYGRIKYRHLLPLYRLLGLMPDSEDSATSSRVEQKTEVVGGRSDDRMAQTSSNRWRRSKQPKKAILSTPLVETRPTKIRFFVIGTGRCGTTLVRDILRLHPEVYVPTESHWIPLQYEICGHLSNPIALYTSIMERVTFMGGEVTLDIMAGEAGISKIDLIKATRAALTRDQCTIVEFNDALFGAVAAAAGRAMVGDKTPDYCAYIPLLSSLWPEAKFVHVIRDGRDAALSMSKHLGYQLMASHSVPNWIPLCLDKRFSMPSVLEREPLLEDYMGLWNIRIRRILDDAVRLPPRSYCELRYERLLRDPMAEAARLANFLDISCPEGWLGEVERIIQPGNTNKIRDRAVWESVTSVARDTLARLHYPV